ncbi:MAG TPA: CocE/NonD family hydrolase [Terriglobales bacterium]|nr:CocE/NonD family hydrolase [Terriglobales bacterium]
MVLLKCARLLVLLVACIAPARAQTSASPPEKHPGLPSEIPDHFTQVTTSFNYTKREVMIPMRDGVKLHAVILIPKGAKNAAMLLTITPYDAESQVGHAASPDLARTLEGYDNPTDVIVEGGYIRVVEDVRGKYGSEGDYVMNRPLRGPLNPTPVDDSTDIYDTIDWLVKNVPESNGKVGVLGISYDGWTTLMAMFHPHPALKVVAPMNPMVDGWMGDDWFHYGAFREQMEIYFQEQEAARGNGPPWWTAYADDYDAWMAAGSAGEMGTLHGLEQTGFWRKVVAHPNYDEFWQDQAVDKLLAAQPLQVPVLLVDSLWDQEDIYGALAVYRAIKPKDKDNDKVFLVLGPWHHAQEIGDGSRLGVLKFPTDTARDFRERILAPFLAQYLKDGAPKADIAPVTAYETGTDRWLRLPAWPAGCPGSSAPPTAKAETVGDPGASTPSTAKTVLNDDSGCTITRRPLYLEPGRKLAFSAPTAGGAAYEEYISDPAKPVPYLPRPVQPFGYGEGSTWPTWLVSDQRHASARGDVLTFVSDTLTEPLKIAGRPVVHLMASTSGTDSDWVVKVIDVYPSEFAPEPKLGGYELMISANIFRGRYRESFTTPQPITPDKPLLYEFALPTADHVFLPGHKIMVQIQSSWFPLYDRNPQTFVENIFWAKPADYKKAVQRIYHAPGEESYIELPVVMQGQAKVP